jgi:hypothetical protein
MLGTDIAIVLAVEAIGHHPGIAAFLCGPGLWLALAAAVVAFVGLTWRDCVRRR